MEIDKFTYQRIMAERGQQIELAECKVGEIYVIVRPNQNTGMFDFLEYTAANSRIRRTMSFWLDGNLYTETMFANIYLTITGGQDCFYSSTLEQKALFQQVWNDQELSVIIINNE